MTEGPLAARARRWFARAAAWPQHHAVSLVRMALGSVTLSSLALGSAAYLLAQVTHLPDELCARPDWRGDAVFVPSGDPENMRTLRAAKIFAEGRAPLVVISGAGTAGDSSAFLADIARGAGVPDGALVLETKATSTFENFEFSRPLLEQRNVHRLLVVTNTSHARRAILLARASLPGIDVKVDVVGASRIPWETRTRELGKTMGEAREGHLPWGGIF